MCIDSDIALFKILFGMDERSFSSCIYMIQATDLLFLLLNVKSKISSLLGIKHVVDFFSQMPCLILNIEN